MLVETGCATQRLGDADTMLRAGDLLFLRPYDAHALFAGPRGCLVMSVVVRADSVDHLGARYAAEFANRFFWSPALWPAAFHLDPAQRERAVNIAAGLSGAERSLARLEHFLLAIITHVLDGVALADARAPSWLLAACRAAHDPAVFRRGAAGFVNAAGRGHAHVCREARRHLGQSPTQIVNAIRTQHAAMRLARSDAAITDIAAECGIENASYFHRLFRIRYGTTPGHYRARHRGRGKEATDRPSREGRRDGIFAEPTP